ncbi:DUF805 domain-containing protein [Aquimarina sp. MMG016]|uniref:DUF805 domain-containing protein n=1 Tax=Aquimarina sp. MMG016 TaxID=2822690 RepID=UPI001B3A3956|nr:DUF805 domain-containing protein [Aquimarina sp. MMG016]MBQ4818929.1 DUF805 domain-containing protein [Aquimarina sp. MMG016]
MNWYLKVLKENYANFEGRARRKEYWMFTLFNVLIILGLYVLAMVFLFMEINALASVFGILYVIYALGVLVPGLAVAVRRLHDTGKSGWMILVGLIPLIGGIWLLVLYVTEGDKGDNEYGPDPKLEGEPATTI